MADDPPSSLQTGQKRARYTTPLTTGSRAEKATKKAEFPSSFKKNLTIHPLTRDRWKNKGTPLTINETEPHINMYPTAKDFTLEESQEAWIQWVNAAFPDLHGTQFWLPVCAKDFASVHCTEEQSTLDTSHQHAPWYNLVKNDSALQRVLLCLKERSEAKDEVMFVLSQLYFGQNSGEPCYSAAADYLPPSHSVPPAPPRNWEEGDFDLLIIHRTYGLVVCEVKAFGDNSSKSGMLQQDVDSKIRSKLKEAILQVDRAEAVLSHLVSDIVPGLRITKTIAFPNLTGDQVQQALAEDPRFTEALCRCLGATDVEGITDLCLTSDQLFVSGTPGTVSTDFGKWWLRCVVGCGSATEISFADYKRLLARFCGPAVTVTVPCLSPPRLSLKTLDQPSSSTSLCHAVITLFPEQVHLLNTATPRVFLTGPPGTGKSLVLQLKATEWLRCGRDVFMVSTQRRGHAPSLITYYLLEQTIETQMAKTGKSGQLHLLDTDLYDYDICFDEYFEEAVTDLLRAAKERPLYVIVDGIGSPSLRYEWYKRFLDKLLARVPDVHCWAVNYDLEFAPSDWQVQHLTRPIRFPKFVEKEAADFHPGILEPYSQRGQHDTTPGTPVQRFLLPKHDHRRHRRFIDDCDTCSEFVVRFLQDLLAGASENTTTSLTSITSTKGDTTSPSLRYRDVLIVEGRYHHINLVEALRNAGIPVQDMRQHITKDMVTSNRDEVWMVSTDDIEGLERKVVVVVGETQPDNYVGVLHCTSQLVFISQTGLPEQWPIVEGRRKTDTDWKYAESISTAEKKNADKKSDRNSDEVCGVESDTNVEETQEKERRKCEDSATCSKKGAEDTEIQKNTNSKCYSFCLKLKLDLREAAAVTPPQHIMESGCPRDDRTEEVSDTSDDTFSSPIFSDHWQVRGCFSAAGGSLQKKGSDVVLQVPAGAIQVKTKVTVHAAVCANDVYIKHKLQLPSTETIVSPLAEFSASTDLPFQKHVQITLPTCLLSNYNVHTCHVYCIRSEKPESQITISELGRLEELSETSEKEKPAAYFYVNGKGQVVVMTTHFSGYVCTSCLQCQNLSLDVYASHRHEHGKVRVFLRAVLWDRLNLREFKKGNPGNDSYRLVLRDTFQLRKMFTPAELLMELTVSDEQQNMWQHIKFQDILPDTRKIFQLNWDKIECTKCINIPAIKYTELGPFCACWTLMSPEGATPSTLEICVRVSHSQIQGQLEPDSSCAPIEIDVRQHTEDENRFSNGSNDKTTINVQYLLGDLHLAPQPSSTG